MRGGHVVCMGDMQYAWGTCSMRGGHVVCVGDM
jgi:formylmethanofuran dehydrogenase subunit C